MAVTSTAMTLVERLGILCQREPAESSALPIFVTHAADASRSNPVDVGSSHHARRGWTGRLAHTLGCKSETSANVVPRQVRVIGENGILTHAGSQQIENIGDGDA